MTCFCKFEIDGTRVTYVCGFVFMSKPNRPHEGIIIRRSLLKKILHHIDRCEEAQQ